MPRSPKNEDTEMDAPYRQSTLEDIDMSLYKFVDNVLDIQTTTNKGFNKVPVIWTGAERAQNVKNNKINRDAEGMIVLPVIAIERGAIVKDLEKKSLPFAALDPRGDIKRGLLTVNKVIKQDKTSNFAKADAHRQKGQLNYPIYRGKKNKKIVYETITIPVPIYVEIDYKINLRAEYQQQMNDMVVPFIRHTNGHRRAMLGHNGNTYEAFVEDSFASNNNIANYQQDEKKFETSLTVKVLGYLIGDGDNQSTPMVVRRENALREKE